MWNMSTSNEEFGISCVRLSFPHLPVSYIFGTKGRSLPDILATGSNRFQIYRDLEGEGNKNLQV